MKKRWFWADWGLVTRLMIAVGIAVVVGGLMQSTLLVIEGTDEHSERLKREMGELLNYLAPTVADQALVGDYAAIDQILKKQVIRTEVERLWWRDEGGRMLSAEDRSELLKAPALFNHLVKVAVAMDTSVEVRAGGVSYGTLHGRMWPANAQNRLWTQFVKQLQIVVATLFLMLQFIWLIFRGNLSTLRDLAAGANRFSQGEHGVRIASEGAPEVRQAADAFNDMAANTERLLETLGQSESKSRLLASIVEQSSEAIWTTDLNGIVTSWNASATTLFGYSASEALGKVHPIGAGNPLLEAARMQRLLKRERFSYDSQSTTKSNAPIELQVAVAPLIDAHGECAGAIAVARDVTERNRSEEALRAARVVAESANNAKSAFLARMSHEIRTPMNGVLGMTELMLETELTSIQRKYAETVHRSGNNLLGIINDVLDFSKIEAGKLELEKLDFDLRRTLEDVVDMLAERAHTKGLELACSIPAGLPLHVVGDALRMGQILTNLAGNAIKFTEQGSVLISMSCVTQDRDMATMRFDVKDTGLGISPEAQSRIFDEFSQADGSTTRQHGGSGLGLAISKQLVEMMQGHLHVESTPGVGSTFWFTAVFAKQSAAQINARADDSVKPMGALTGVRALIVESNVLSRGILHAQVNSWGMSTRVAESPENALELLKLSLSRGAPFDIAIIDLGFTGGDPLDLTRAIRALPALRRLKLLMLAPVGNHAVLQEARTAGLDACLVKPVRQSALYDALVNVVSGESMLSEARSPGRDDAPAPVGTRGAILLVEDNLVNQAVALGILNQLLGYKDVTVANHGKEALDAYQSKRFDVILMDCHMPEMDGFRATREIRKLEAVSGRRVPIIALTANAMAQDREDCMNAGMDDHLGKPFSRKQIKEMLDRWMPDESQRVSAQDGVPTMPTMPTEQAADVLDQRVLGQFQDMQNKQYPDLLVRVLKIYLAESPKEMTKLLRAMNDADLAQVGRSAHSLKSSSANIGAITLSQLAAELEKAGRGSDLAACRALYPKVVSEHAHAQVAIGKELTRFGAA